MAIIISKSRSTTVCLKYVERRSNGSFQYRRRIPSDLQHLYGGKLFFVRSLQRDQNHIVELCSYTTEKLDKSWNFLRSRIQAGSYENSCFDSDQVSIPVEITGKLRPSRTSDNAPKSNEDFSIHNNSEQCISFSQALMIYLLLH